MARGYRDGRWHPMWSYEDFKKYAESPEGRSVLKAKAERYDNERKKEADKLDPVNHRIDYIAIVEDPELWRQVPYNARAKYKEFAEAQRVSKLTNEETKNKKKTN